RCRTAIEAQCWTPSGSSLGGPAFIMCRFPMTNGRERSRAMTDTRSGATLPQDSPISGLVDKAQTLASTVAETAQDKARRLAEEQKAAAAEQVADVARVLDTAADQVERVLPDAAPYVRAAAS